MGVDERITINVERLRDALVNETGPAAFAGSPWAIVDVAALEDAFQGTERVKTRLVAQGLVYYPSDHRKFKFHVAFAACRRRCPATP